MFQDKQNLAVPSRRKVKIIHSLVPDGHLGTWHISALGPHVRFTLDEHGGLVAAEVEAAEFFPFTDANWCGKIRDSSMPRWAKKFPTSDSKSLPA
jgi:hypothetical protein